MFFLLDYMHVEVPLARTALTLVLPVSNSCAVRYMPQFIERPLEIDKLPPISLRVRPVARSKFECSGKIPYTSSTIPVYFGKYCIFKNKFVHLLGKGF